VLIAGLGGHCWELEPETFFRLPDWHPHWLSHMKNTEWKSWITDDSSSTVLSSETVLISARTHRLSILSTDVLMIRRVFSTSFLTLYLPSTQSLESISAIVHTESQQLVHQSSRAVQRFSFLSFEHQMPSLPSRAPRISLAADVLGFSTFSMRRWHESVVAVLVSVR